MTRPLRSAILAATVCFSLVLCSAAQAPAASPDSTPPVQTPAAAPPPLPSSATPSSDQPIEAPQPEPSSATPSPKQPAEAPPAPAPSTTPSSPQPVEAPPATPSSATPSEAPPATPPAAASTTSSANQPAWPDTIQVQRPGKPITYADMDGNAPEATGTKKHPNHHVPPTWSPFYNADKGALPDTTNWRVLHSARNLVVTLAPGADWSRYSKVQSGLARYTGTELDLTPRQIANVTDLLQSQIEKKLPKARLGTPAAATGTLQVDVNLTDAIVNDPSGIPALAVSMAPAREWRSQVVAWVWDAQTHQPVACIHLIAADDAYEVVWGLRPTGRLRAALRSQADLLADTLAHIQHKLITTGAAK